MKKRKENIRQHYVPQTYYRNFTLNRNAIKVFDYRTKNEFITSIKKISNEDYFYDIDKRLIPMYIQNAENDEQIVDKYIKSYLEDGIGVILQNFSEIPEIVKDLQDNEGVYLDPYNIASIVNFIIIQLIRTPRFRKEFESVGEAVLETLSTYEIPEELSISSEEWTKITHNIYVLEVINILLAKEKVIFQKWVTDMELSMTELVEKLVEGFYNAGTIVQFSEVDKPFITSDHPVCIEWSGDFMKNGFNFVSMPITSKINIIFFDKDKLPLLKQYDQKIYVIGEDKINLLDNMNLLVTKHSSGRIYADPSYNFELEKSFVEGKIPMRIEL